MSLVDLSAAAALVGMIAYGILGGADFGGGIWDLVATGPRKEERRQRIAEAMGPVWEANHVWLVFVVVVFFSSFPGAWAAYATALATPLRLALVGIALRGVAFVFRSYVPERGPGKKRWGLVFGWASLLTPFVLGSSVGAISSGRLRIEGLDVRFVEGPPWLDAVSIAMGLAAVSMCAHLAAVFLAVETRGELQEDFRKRGLATWLLVVVGAAVTLPFTYFEAPHLFHALTSVRLLPIVLMGCAGGLVGGFALSRRRYVAARLGVVVGVASLIVGWAAAQYPYLIYPDVTLAEAAAPEAMLRFLLLSLPFGLAIVIPSIVLLFRVFKGDAARVL